MKIRTTERQHDFTNELFKNLNIFSLEGLTMDENNNFTAGIEYIEFDKNEEINFEKCFKRKFQIDAKFYVTEKLGIPLFFIGYKNNCFNIFKVSKNNAKKFNFEKTNSLDDKEFVNWWRKWKKTLQNKPFYEAQSRSEETYIDSLLEVNNLKWGGNIDGIMFKKSGITAIIENIYSGKYDLNTKKANPANYFHNKGPNYNSWYPVVQLANIINVPLYLLTFDPNSDNEILGFSIIKELNKSGIFYKDNISPNNNLIEGKKKIIDSFLSELDSNPPLIKDNN